MTAIPGDVKIAGKRWSAGVGLRNVDGEQVFASAAISGKPGKGTLIGTDRRLSGTRQAGSGSDSVPASSATSSSLPSISVDQRRSVFQSSSAASPSGWSGGFDVVLGNPPWERVKLQEKEWFAERNPDIANAPNAAARKRLIEALRVSEPPLHAQFLDAIRQAEGESHLLRNTDRFPLCGRGDINVYTVFAESMRSLVSPTGRSGCVLPSGIATDDTTKFFFQDVVETNSLVSLFDFENRAGIFPAVDSRMKFCLFTTRSPVAATTPDSPLPTPAEFVFFAHQVEDLADPERRFTLSAEDIALLNPNTRTCPIFRSRRDAELTKSIYQRIPVFFSVAKDASESIRAKEARSWPATLFTMLHSSGAAHLFQDSAELAAIGMLHGNRWRANGKEFLPLYEGKMFHQFDHRFASVTMTDNLARPAQPNEATLPEHVSPDWLPTPRAWVEMQEIASHCPEGAKLSWFVAFKDVTSSTNERTLLATVLPTAPIVDSVNLIGFPEDASGESAASLVASLNSFALDYVVRQKIGGMHIKFYLLNQLPILPPDTYSQPCPWSGPLQSAITHQQFLLPRVLELTYTAWDLEPFARDCGYAGPPFRWDEARRFLLRAELDAAFFHLYGLHRDDTAYILDTFPIVRRKDIAQHGEYRTQRVILEIYDALAAATRTGQPYQTRLDPPPADPRVAHPPKGSSS
jgi:hypothetical protein